MARTVTDRASGRPTSGRPTSLLWFRRDLRLTDHPALLAAIEDGEVLPVVCPDDAALAAGELPRLRWTAAARSLSEDIAAQGGRLVVAAGDPELALARLAARVGAQRVHVTRETDPPAAARDARVRERLAADGVELVGTGTPYAVGPGLVMTKQGTPYAVFTPFSRAWREHGWPGPAPAPSTPRWAAAPDESLSDGELPSVDDPRIDPATVGERAALDRLGNFLADDLARYADERDRPDLDTTSRLSVPLRHGEIHPRTILAAIDEVTAGWRDARAAAAGRFVTELAWREFYADVLHHDPVSAWEDLRGTLVDLPYDDADEPAVARRVEAWREGRTGYPIVDAGMRQLRDSGWMHNRVRMITASFLVKDLHVWWPVGARHFLDHLLDGDLASNNHGWQWVAGTGTDASPFFRVFNPTLQGTRLDPSGEYVRRWVPELAHVRGKGVHTPWKTDGAYDEGYPRPIVDHDLERREALARYEATRR